MPDLNELLKWSIANSTPKSEPNGNSEDAAQHPDEPLSLRFNPPSDTPSTGSSALHPSDPHYRAAPTDLALSSSNVRADQSDTGAGAAGPTAETAKRNTLNSDILEMIMGRPDSAVMKEKMGFAMDESLPVDERVEALDDFEMVSRHFSGTVFAFPLLTRISFPQLIEMLDNANNMAVLKLWKPLLSLLSSPHESLVAHTCWIIGTAVQNNLKAQGAVSQAQLSCHRPAS